MSHVWGMSGTPHDGVPATLATATARVAHDLLTEPAITREFPELRWTFDPASRMFGFADLSAQTVELMAEEDMTVVVADLAQNEFAGYQYIPWPTCPFHDHPMEARVQGGKAVWRCRTTHAPVAAIGQLTPAHRAHPEQG